MYTITINGKAIKAYPHYIQCITWVMLNGFASCGGGRLYLDDSVKIIEG